MTWYISDVYVTVTEYPRQLTYKEKKVSLAQDLEDFSLLVKGTPCGKSICVGAINHIVAHSPF